MLDLNKFKKEAEYVSSVIADEVFSYRKENVHVVGEAKVEHFFNEQVRVYSKLLGETFSSLSFNTIKQDLELKTVNRFISLCV